MSASEPLVLHTVADGVATLTLNRPDRKNAWSLHLETAYYAALRACAEDTEVRVIVVTGAGTIFCPGMDSEGIAATDSAQSPIAPRLPISFPREIPKPVIAAINGACAGVGLVAALNCDLRFAAESAKLTTSFAHRGLMAEHGVAWLLPRLIGTSRSLDLLFSARVMRGSEAVDIGLVDRAFPDDELLAQTLEFARALAATSSPIAMASIKQQVYAAQESSYGEARDASFALLEDLHRGHPDLHEGFASFFERRAPRFEPLPPRPAAQSGL